MTKEQFHTHIGPTLELCEHDTKSGRAYVLRVGEIGEVVDVRFDAGIVEAIADVNQRADETVGMIHRAGGYVELPYESDLIEQSKDDPIASFAVRLVTLPFFVAKLTVDLIMSTASGVQRVLNPPKPTGPRLWPEGYDEKDFV